MDERTGEWLLIIVGNQLTIIDIHLQVTSWSSHKGHNFLSIAHLIYFVNTFFTFFYFFNIFRPATPVYPKQKTQSKLRVLFNYSGAGGRTRTYDGGTPADLQSAVIATRRLQHISITPIYYTIYGAANETWTRDLILTMDALLPTELSRHYDNYNILFGSGIDSFGFFVRFFVFYNIICYNSFVATLAQLVEQRFCKP